MQPNTSPRVAAVGAGAWGKNIVRTLSRLGALAAVAETADHLRAEISLSAPGVHLVSNYHEILTRPDIDAVAIATPAATHFDIAKDALLAGKDVFVEKPIALTVAEAEALADLADNLDRILMVGHLLLYHPSIRFVKKFVGEGRLGTIFTLHQDRLKLGRVRTVESVLWSLAVHDVAVLLYLVGRSPVQVTASGHRGLQTHLEDDMYLHMDFGDNIHASLHNSWLWPEDRRVLTIIGANGMLTYDEGRHKVIWHRKRANAQLETLDEGAEVVHEWAGQPLDLELEHFCRCVKTRQRPRSDGRNGVEVLRVLEAAATPYESAPV